MNESIENEVFNLRKEKNITQEELASALEVTRQTIIAIEKGNYIPSLALGIKIAKYFKKPVEGIFKLKNEK